MFCIAAFIVLAVLGIFSASHRKLVKKAWSCTLHRITFRPCDTSFKEETKSKLLSKVANRKPGLVKLADVGIEIASFLLVIFTVWSLLSVLESGLYLAVWGTCNPNQASSCSLTSETCSIDKVNKGFIELTMEGKPQDWFVQKAQTLAETFANIPVKFKNWDATNYLPKDASYYYKFDSSKPTALEIVDPGCTVCSRLYKNILNSNFKENYNFTYIVFPIENINKPGEYKFKNSYTISSFIEAIKLNPLENLKTPADWQILGRVFSWKNSDNVYYQDVLNATYSKAETVTLIKSWLSDIGYSNEQISQIELVADGQKVEEIIESNKKIVTEQIKTVKIPTIIFDGKRFSEALSVDRLNS